MLKTFLSQEEQAAPADPISVDDVYATSMDDDEGEDASRERERALVVVDQLETANEAWQKIVKSAIKENRATPELCAGIEAHIQRISHELGEHVELECASIEAAGDDVELFLSQVETSLESFSGKLAKIKNSILEGMSKLFNNSADRKKQIAALKALGNLANKIAASVKEKHGNEMSTKVTLDTGRYTTAFTSQGKVVSNPVLGIARHMAATMDMYSDFCTKTLKDIVDLVEIARQVFQSKEFSEVYDTLTKIPNMPTTASRVPAKVVTGETLLGNIRLELPKKDPKWDSDKEQLSKYIARRGQYSVPHWKAAGPRAESTDITLSYADIHSLCKEIQKDCDALIRWFTETDQKAERLFTFIGSLKEANNPLGSVSRPYVYVYVDVILKAVKAETAGGMTPIQQLAYRNMSIIRGWLGLFSKA